MIARGDPPALIASQDHSLQRLLHGTCSLQGARPSSVEENQVDEKHQDQHAAKGANDRGSGRAGRAARKNKLPAPTPESPSSNRWLSACQSCRQTASHRPTEQSDSRTPATLPQWPRTKSPQSQTRRRTESPRTGCSFRWPRPAPDWSRSTRTSCGRSSETDQSRHTSSAVFATSALDTARILPTSMSFRCSVSPVALLMARIAVADATA